MKHQQADLLEMGFCGVTMICMILNGRCARRVIACLLAGVCQSWMLGEGYAQAPVPRNVRSDRATENPILLGDQKANGLTYAVDATTEVLANLVGGTTRTGIWESLLIAGVEVDFEKAAGVPGLSLTVSGL